MESDVTFEDVVNGIEEIEVLEGEQVYLLMKKEYRLSRNTRAHWYFSHLNTEIKVCNRQSLAEFTGDLDVVSVVPREPVPADWDWDTGHLYSYRVSPTSMVTFLSQQYKFVYLLDYSPSAACTDIKKGTVLLDQMVTALRRSLDGVTRPFFVPGSQLLFKPDIFVSVIAWTPFLCNGSQSVLHQGWLLTPDNIDDFMKEVTLGLNILESHIARVAAIVIDELETIKMQSERIMGGLFDESVVSVPLAPSIPMAAPDTGFVNMIQTGLLALQLLPQHSSGGLIVITDGVINTPDVTILDPLLNQLRTKMTSLSFLQVSSYYHPHVGLGYCPYNELMEFMSLATSGAYLARAPEVEPSEPYLYVMNDYHDAFLAWSFRKCLEGIKIQQPTVKIEKVLFRKGMYSEIKNPFFLEASQEPLIEKKRMEMTVNTNLTSILSCRMREGYTVNSVAHNEQEMKVKLTLPWKYQTFIHYTVVSAWPQSSSPDWDKCKVEVHVEGPYDILYDIICQRDKQFTSHHRMSVIKKFNFILQHLTQTDILLVHLHSFTSNPAHYAIPDPIRNGLPLFTTMAGSSTPVLYSPDFSHPIFAKFWQPVCSLDLAIWHRWMHTDRIGLVLQHDHPLPKHLLTTSSNGRYHSVQCRKAAGKVYELLKGWTEFCLLENNSYIRFIRDEKEQPLSFYVIRVTSKPPCFVVWLAFLGGTAGSLRHSIYNELLDKLKSLTITQRVCWRDLPAHRIKNVDSSSSEGEDESSSETEAKPKTASSPFSEVFACVSMTKPVEKILVRYDRMPSDFCTLLGPFSSRSYSPVGLRVPETASQRSHRNATAAFLTLSRFVSHRRWIWSVQSCPEVPVSATAVARILNTICKLRLHQGFAFAHSSTGIQNMVLEVPLSGPEGEQEVTEKEAQTCVLQYLIFPPHTTSSNMEDSICEEEEEERQDEFTETDGEVQIVTELWTEPQTGRVLRTLPPELDFIKGLSHREISKQFFPRDLECVSTLATFEHLCLMCQNNSVPSPSASSPLSPSTPPYLDTSEAQLHPLEDNDTIKHIPFAFDLLSLLPKSHQTELLFSLLVQDLSSPYSWYPGHKPFADRPNEMVFEQLFAELDKISDREVELNDEDHKAIPDLIKARQSDNFRFKSQSSSQRPMSSPSAPHTPGSKDTPLPQRQSFGRRNHSGASGLTSSSNENSTYRDSINLGERLPSDLYNLQEPRWRCFVKAISPTHLVLTLLPASFQDLKALTLSEDIISTTPSRYVNIVTKAFSRTREEEEGLNSLSINSSLSHLETFPVEFPDPRTTHPDVSGRRQRSGSDVFEMTRPKPPTVRKTSGDAVVMRDRTSSLDGFSQFKAKAVLGNLSQLPEDRDRNRAKSMDSKPAAECKNSVTNKALVSKSTSGASKGTQDSAFNPCSTPKSPWPLREPPSPIYGSVALPIYVYDCSVAGLTSSLLFGQKVEKPRNFYLDFLFQPEARSNAVSEEEVEKEVKQEVLETVRDEEQKTPEPQPNQDSCEFHHRDEMPGHIDREIKQRCQIIQMIYFKSFVSVLFRCLQLNLPVHSYDVQHSMDYCDNESSLELDLEPFIQAACSHSEYITQSKNEETVTKETDICEVEKQTVSVIDTDRLKSAKVCSKIDAIHKDTQASFSEILSGQFKVVPSHPDLFFFCPPGLDIGVLETSSGRKRNETRSSEGTGKNLFSGSSGRLRAGLEEEEDRTIEFKSELDEYSIKLQKQDSRSECTDVETGQRDGHSNISVLSHLESESEDGDESESQEQETDYSPPLFIQFCLSISQDKEDIVCSPVKHLPTCLAEILQDPSVPDPEQDLDITTLGLRLDLICMTLPKLLECLTENLQSLRSTSLCSSTSYRDSASLPDDDHLATIDIDDDLNSGSDVLAHLPEYQHRAVTSVLDEMRWMLRDEIAFAKTKAMPFSQLTLEFVRNHVQSSVGKAGSMVESIHLNFVFGSGRSLEKFKESFRELDLSGFILRESGDYYYLDLKRRNEEEKDEEKKDGNRRKSARLSRHLQLSPVKETAPAVTDELGNMEEPPNAPDSSINSSDSSSDCVIELLDLEKDLSAMSEKAIFISNFSCIFQVEQERVNMYIHFRDNIPQVKNTWKTVHVELVNAIKSLCTQVNQCLLLNDLYDTRTCNRLLEPESTRDIFSDHGRHLSQDDDGDDAPYLEANLNMKFAPGKFKCPEVWETTFNLHPRLKQGQGHNSQSRGLQAVKNVLLPYQVINRTNMFVYKDDTKNVFYMKMSESLSSNFCSTNVLSRQSSIVETDTPSRSSSVGSSKQLGRKDTIEEGQYSRSNSIGESDRNKAGDDKIIVKVFGIQQAGKNIREDLMSVLQKKLDDKVVEVISMMLQRNSRCKLATEDVLFLQRPGQSPDYTHQFAVHPETIKYLQAVAFYLRQNMVTIPLIMPNYTTTSTTKFRDQPGEENDNLENDVFLYNDFNPGGGHKGIGCISLSIVFPGGGLVRHITYPKPAIVQGKGLELQELEQMIQSEMYNGEEEVENPPVALIQFRIWEQGRIDMDRLISLLQCSIKHALWDAILEYRLLPAPLAEKYEDEEGNNPDQEEESGSTTDSPNKLNLEGLSAAASACFDSTVTSPDVRRKPSLPDIVIEAADLDKSVTKTDPWEEGFKGRLHHMYSHAMFCWLQTGLDIDVPSVYRHTVTLVAKHSLPLVLKEMESQVAAILPDLGSRAFIQIGDHFVPFNRTVKSCGENFILMSRNFQHWAAATRAGPVDPLMMKTKTAKATENFHPLLLPPYTSMQDLPPPSPSVLQTPQQQHQSIASPSSPLTPITPAFSTSGLQGMLQTIQTSNQVFVPRQRFAIARVSKKEIIFYLYNLSKDCLDRLVRQTSHLGHWFTARSSLMSSIVAQKMGLFHNQHFFRPESKSNNPYIGSVATIDSLIKHHCPPSTLATQTKTRQATGLGFRNVYKNSKPSKPLHQVSYASERDALGRHGRQMLAVWGSEQRECQHRLYLLWQSRGENCNDVYTPELIQYFKQKSRLLHYVLTPMLFLPQWRWQANATRDHVIHENPLQEASKRSSSASALMETYRLRHGSGGSRGRSLSGQGSASSPSQRSPTSSPKMALKINQNETFHYELLTHYFQEYVQYLQTTLGFMPIESKVISKKSGSKFVEDSVGKRRHITGSNLDRESPRGSTRSDYKTVYLQKSLLGGILIFEIGISEPFLSTKLHALEASRIQLKTNQSLTGKTFTTTFLDECDRIKVLIHLHSFTYDYHLRTIHNHIAQKPSNLRKGFHIVSFLDDFIKYYSKGPNFARNFVHSGFLQIPSLAVSPTQLFNYLLDHEKTYGMNVIRMEPVIIDPSTEFDNEYVLVQLSNHRVIYTDHQDVKRTDDFDVSLILSYDVCHLEGGNQNVLTLKYFVTMTSKREHYPMFGVEKKLGKFRTVSSSQSLRMIKKMLQSTHPSSLLPSTISSTSGSRETSPEQEGESISSIKTNLGKVNGIRSESVNYIGYYSAHEETMKSVIASQALAGEARVENVVRGAMVDCRRDQLWQKLQQESSTLSHREFLELIELVHHQTLDRLDPQLYPLMKKSVSWYLGLSKVLHIKYGLHCRQFSSLDGKVQHTVVLNQDDMGTFGLVSMDSTEGSLAIVHKEELMPSVTRFLEGFVEAAAFHLWTGLL